MKPQDIDTEIMADILSHSIITKEELRSPEMYHPGFSIDCVIFGFYKGCLKVLLSKYNGFEKWMLPSGLLLKNESIDDAAYRILEKRTNLKDIYLKQFAVFADPNRSSDDENILLAKALSFSPRMTKWLQTRFIAVGYYALVEYSKVDVFCDKHDESIEWFSINELPALYSDHKSIIEKAIRNIRKQIGYVPIGYELLPEKFTMPELRTIYEAIIGHEIDRRNFQRKILSIGLVEKLNESRKGGAYKSPILYSFVKERYEAVKTGSLIADLRMLLS